MESSTLDETKLLLLIGLLISILIAVTVLFGIAWFNDLRHSADAIDAQSCYRKLP